MFLRPLFFILVVPLFVSALAGLVSVLIPQQLHRARQTAANVPATAALVGFGTLGIFAGLTFVYALSLALVVTLIFIPLVILVWLAVAAALFCGWIVIAQLVGWIILARLNVYAAPMTAAVVGAFTLSLFHGIFGSIPCIGFFVNLVWAMLGCAGLGALLLTRFGTRTYPSMTLRQIEMA